MAIKQMIVVLFLFSFGGSWCLLEADEINNQLDSLQQQVVDLLHRDDYYKIMIDGLQQQVVDLLQRDDDSKARFAELTNSKGLV